MLRVTHFAQHDDTGCGWATAAQVTRDLAARGVEARLIDRLSANLDDLMLVVKHGVVSTPTVVVELVPPPVTFVPGAVPQTGAPVVTLARYTKLASARALLERVKRAVEAW